MTCAYASCREDCFLWQPTLSGVYPCEIHITVQTGDAERFRKVCQALGVKAIFIKNEHRSGDATPDWLTSSVMKSPLEYVYRQVDRIAATLTQLGFEVTRRKVETLPTHPDAPRNPGDAFPPGTYFEAHIPVRKPLHAGITAAEDSRLRPLAKDLGLFISTNTSKETGEALLTLRSYDTPLKPFQDRREHAEEALMLCGYELGDVRTEFALLDSDPDYDRQWMS